MEGEEADCLKQCIRIPTCITVLMDLHGQRCWMYEGDDVYAKPGVIKPREHWKIVSLGKRVDQPLKSGPIYSLSRIETLLLH